MLGISYRLLRSSKKIPLLWLWLHGRIIYMNVVKIPRCISHNTSKAVFGFPESSKTAFSVNSQEWANVGHRRVSLHGCTNSSSIRINHSARPWDWSPESPVDPPPDPMRNRPGSIFSSRARRCSAASWFSSQSSRSRINDELLRWRKWNLHDEYHGTDFRLSQVQASTCLHYSTIERARLTSRLLWRSGCHRRTSWPWRIFCRWRCVSISQLLYRRRFWVECSSRRLPRGKILTGALKKRCILKLQASVKCEGLQERRSTITDSVLDDCMKFRPLIRGSKTTKANSNDTWIIRYKEPLIYFCLYHLYDLTSEIRDTSTCHPFCSGFC